MIVGILVLLAVAVCILVMLVLSAIVLVVIVLQNRPAGQSDATINEAHCSACERPMVFRMEDLSMLSPPEVALVVRQHKNFAGAKMAEYICPYCETAHCYAVLRSGLHFLGTDLYSPALARVKCQECRKPLQRPSWPKGAFDLKIDDAPGLGANHGLVCSRCQSVICYECTQKATRGRTKDGSLLCPRCFRGPVDRFWHES